MSDEFEEIARQRLAAHLGVSRDIAQRIWRETAPRPHRLSRYLASNNPDLDRSARILDARQPGVARLHL